jgi:hypothetical protein
MGTGKKPVFFGGIQDPRPERKFRRDEKNGCLNGFFDALYPLSSRCVRTYTQNLYDHNIEKAMKLVSRLAIFICIAASGCESTRIVPQQINYLTAPDPIKFHEFDYGDKVQVTLINVNRFIYKVTADTVSQDFNTAVPAVFSALTLPAKIAGNGHQDGMRSAMAKGLNESPATHRTGFKEEYDNIVTAAEAINKAIDAHNQVMAIATDCNSTGDAIIQNALEKLNELAVPVIIPGATIATIADNWKRSAIGQVQAADDAWKSMTQYAQSFNESRYGLFKTLSMASLQNVADRQDDLNKANEAIKMVKDKTKLPAMQADLVEKKTALARAQEQATEVKEDYDHELKTMADRMTEAKTLLDNIHKLTDDGKIYTIFNDLKKINASSFQYNAPLVKMTHDEIKVTFAVASDALLSCPVPNEKKFPVFLRTKKGLKVDFSTGIFINGGNVDFIGKDYYFKPVTADSSVIAYPHTGNKAIVSLGALMHLYFRSTWAVKPALSIGASVNTGATIVNLHLGPSVIIGNKNRVVISGGLTLRESTVLDRDYAEYKVYAANILPAAVPTVTKFPIAGYFFSLTYNLSSLGN